MTIGIPSISAPTSAVLPSVVSRSAASGKFAAELEAAGRGALVDQVRELTSQLVATAFIQPALSIARDSSMHGERFAPGAAERRFAPLVDQQIADRVTTSANFPLIERLTEHVLERYARSGGAADGS